MLGDCPDGIYPPPQEGSSALHCHPPGSCLLAESIGRDPPRAELGRGSGPTRTLLRPFSGAQPVSAPGCLAASSVPGCLWFLTALVFYLPSHFCGISQVGFEEGTQQPSSPFYLELEVWRNSFNIFQTYLTFGCFFPTILSFNKPKSNTSYVPSTVLTGETAVRQSWRLWAGRWQYWLTEQDRFWQVSAAVEWRGGGQRLHCGWGSLGRPFCGGNPWTKSSPTGGAVLKKVQGRSSRRRP